MIWAPEGVTRISTAYVIYDEKMHIVSTDCSAVAVSAFVRLMKLTQTDQY